MLLVNSLPPFISLDLRKHKIDQARYLYLQFVSLMNSFPSYVVLTIIVFHITGYHTKVKRTGYIVNVTLSSIV